MLIRQRYDLPPLTQARQTASLELQLDKNCERLTGILLTADRDEKLYYRGALSVSLSGKEVFPEDYHAKLLMSGLGVAPKDRYLPLDEVPGNGVLKIRFSDTDSPVQTFDAYTVSVYLEIELAAHG